MAEKILIVDDHPVNRYLLSGILKKAGYEILEAVNGEDAIDIALRELPDCILLDIVMPKKNGYEVCFELKRNSLAENIPIIFFSAKSETEEKIRGLELGGADYITRPFDKGEVLARVENQLKINNLTKSLIEVNNQLLEKQRCLDEDLNAAAQIQKSLITKTPPRVNNFAFAWRFIPCDRIGGDIFNIHRLDESYLSVYVVDVSGHGVPSAMVTVSVSQTLSPQTGSVLKKDVDIPPYYKIISPSNVLKHLDQEYPIERFDKYFTISYLIINTHSGYIRYSSAAHPIPVLVRANGGIEPLDKGGTIIGMGGMTPFEEGETVMQQGDRLFLYTDGIVEYTNNTGEYYGKERFYNELLENCAEPLEITCERTIESLIAYGGGAQPQDDITLLAIECQGIEKSAPGEGNDKLLLFEKEEKMLIEMKQEGEVMVIKSLEKRMDARIATDFKEKMAAFIKEGQNLFVLDISGVEFIDSSALGAIISSLKLIGQKGNLVIAGATESVLSMFKLTRMDKVFRLFKNEKEAVSALST